ncbi:Oligopeptidase A [hydrothermal vent metagenome]|uniref:oligopeptidase A n=1 Tax=hydrothermal vent metagenome TaxID=652676 RepID=A0A3B1AIG4_9ZZZZ
MPNPLLTFDGLPPFKHIKPEHIEPAIDALLAENRLAIETVLAENETYSWDNFIQPLEEVGDKLDKAWSPVSHMNSVVNSDELRDAYNACLPKLSEFATEVGQHASLFKAYQSIADSDEYQILDRSQKKIIDNALRDFKLSGIDLSDDKKARYKEIKQALTKLTTKYEENVLDATHAWFKLISDETQLAGLPDSAIAMAKQMAQNNDREGWEFTLDFPSYYAIITYSDHQQLRQEIYTAYVTRASDQGPNSGEWDNSEIMDNIVANRHELAQLLGFKNYAERSLATKMAQNTDEVLAFLQNLAIRSKPFAERDKAELLAYTKEHHQVEDLNAWDLSYYSEKLRQHKYAITQEELKPYFPETSVVKGMFEVVKRLYGIEINQVKRGIETWHPDVRFYEIKDKSGKLRGKFYLDLYAREHKRGGAWMDDCMARMRYKDGSIQTPVAYLTCNLTPPVGGDPALFTHDEVTTLFHEFGHGLHHMLTKIDYVGVSGINGVAWDAVELPSQFMENWCWERDALKLFAKHYQTKKLIPQELFDRMQAAKNFQSGMLMVRQLEFSIFDFKMHLEFDPTKGARIQEILDQVRQDVAVNIPPTFNRFQHGFSHIFAGGYAAGYYSYKWAEVLSADAFALFEENGIFDKTTGHAFLTNILELGGSREPMELFTAFRGRQPEIDALLRHCGIAA